MEPAKPKVSPIKSGSRAGKSQIKRFSTEPNRTSHLNNLNN